MIFTTAKVVGTPSKSAWAQVHSFTPSDEDAKEARGEFIGVFAVSGLNEETEAVRAGKEILTRLHEEYYGRKEGTPFEALKSAFSKIKDEFSEGAKVGIVAAVSWRGYLYLSAIGGGRVYIWREGKLSKLLEGGDSPVVISGKAKEKDVLVLGSEAFFETAAPETLRGFLEKSTAPTDVVEDIVPLMHAKSRPSLSGAVLKITGVDKRPEQPELAQTTVSLKEKFRSLAVKIASKLPDKGVSSLAVQSIKKDKSKRTAVSVGLILLVLLLLSIGLGIRQKSLRQYRSQYEDRLVKAQDLFSDSILQKDVNSLQSRESFLEAKGLVEELSAEGVVDSRLENLKASILEETANILGIVETDLVVFLDLSLVRAEVDALQMSLDEGVLSVLDRAGRIMSIVVKDKKLSVLAADRGEPKLGALYAGRHFYLGDEGIFESSRSKSQIVIERDEEWGDIAALGAFGSNLYLLDKSARLPDGQGEVWRYPGIEGGFGSKQKWLGEGVEPDFSRAQDMTIDGSIWILTKSGKIAKFTRGSPESFNIKGLDKGLNDPQAVYTSEKLESIFVLDKGNRRIVEIGKDGEYKKQYLSDGIEEVRDIAISPEGKIFLLTQTKILEIPSK